MKEKWWKKKKGETFNQYLKFYIKYQVKNKILHKIIS
jgi:hypothetical protein